MTFEPGYESSSDFRTTFAELFSAPFGKAGAITEVIAEVTVARLQTPLGPMVAGVSDQGLCLLEFVERRMLATQIRRLQRGLGCAFVPGDHAYLDQARRELDAYFAGELREFTLPLVTPGTGFQQRVWSALRDIPYGTTRSYDDLARRLSKPGGQRAVGRANGDNRIAIIIPCHRVVRADGKLGGYGGGLWRKEFLLALEGGGPAGQRPLF